MNTTPEDATTTYTWITNDGGYHSVTGHPDLVAGLLRRLAANPATGRIAENISIGRTIDAN